MSDNPLFWLPERPRQATSTSPGTDTAVLEREHGAPPLTPPPPRHGWRSAAAAAGLSALVFGGAGVGVGVALDHNSGSGAGANPGLTVSQASSTDASRDPQSYAAIAAKVLPSVVNINVAGASESGTGTGVVLRSDGTILTNNHVVAPALDGGTISVTFNDGSTASARVVGADAEYDLAVIKVSKSGLQPATLGASSAVKVGDAVLAVGSPLGLQGTVTAGIVSALNRPVVTGASQSQDPLGGGTQSTQTVIDAIQTDAAINPGNSGGPLVNAAGEVVGINSAIASTGSGGSGQSGNIGVGFAIPVDQARVVAQELITTGKATHPLLGVTLADATDSTGADLARVQSVQSGGAADKAGIRAGDVIVAVGDQKTAGADAVIAAIRAHQPGQRLTVTVLRGGARQTVTVTLADAANAQG